MDYEEVPGEDYVLLVLPVVDWSRDGLALSRSAEGADDGLGILRRMFPSLDEEVIMETLESCHGDEDRAVEQLLSLDRLSSEEISNEEQRRIEQHIQVQAARPAVPSLTSAWAGGGFKPLHVIRPVKAGVYHGRSNTMQHVQRLCAQFPLLSPSVIQTCYQTNQCNFNATVEELNAMVARWS